MSRKLGRWQRRILAALEAHPIVYLRDLLPKDRPQSHYQALYRAAHSLAASGKIAIWQGGLSRPMLKLARLGVDVQTVHVPRISVESDCPESRLNT